jgi:tRNA U38,U39,U40 pseudouridine synthase TruA
MAFPYAGLFKNAAEGWKQVRRMKRRVKLIVAYDGTNYHGWQIQPEGDTIEAQLNKNLSALLR